MTKVMVEAYEMVEDEFITDDDFKAFSLANAVRLHGGMNPDFFKGTAVEAEAENILAESAASTIAAE